VLFGIIFQASSAELLEKLFVEHKFFEVLTERLSLSEYRAKPCKRKDIYAFIEQLIIWITDHIEDTQLSHMKTLIPRFEPYWTALCNAIAINKKTNLKDWGSFQGPLVQKKRPRDAVREHESKVGNASMEAGAKGT